MVCSKTMSAQPYQNLTPDVILDAVESCGYRCDGRQYPLNSFENRVYQVWCDDGAVLVAKFYRPQRWSNAAILEEHAFARELVAREVPVVAPLADAGGKTLHECGGYRFALFPKQAGRAPELDNTDTLRWLGRFLGRIHAVGALKPFEHRPLIDIESFGEEPARFVIENDFVPEDLVDAYEAIVNDALERIEQCYGRAGAARNIRLHGDCHAGNILWHDDGPHFVDLDDCRKGPAVQDLWMLLSGDAPAMSSQLSHVLAGYQEFCEFNPSELALIEALRTMRMIHYAGWLANRWDDPAFPANFPWFNTLRYWQDQILALREQCSAMDEPPLEVDY
jgi:Ser/Thr protein kinase RdoA (MazF antagonist)